MTAPSNGDGQRDRRPSNERREESAFDRFEARPSDRSGMRAGDFAAGKMITASCIRTTPSLVPSTSHNVRRVNEGLCLAARLTEHVVAPVRGGIRSPMVYQATDPFYCVTAPKVGARSLGWQARPVRCVGSIFCRKSWFIAP
jgi:hypothetical protein